MGNPIVPSNLIILKKIMQMHDGRLLIDKQNSNRQFFRSLCDY